MKNLAKRTLSLLLAALMVLALIPAPPHAHAAAVNEAVMGVNNSGAAYTNNHISVVTASSGVKAYKLAGNVPCYAYAIPKSGYGIFALSADFLDAEFDGKATVEIEYLNAYSSSLTILEDYSFSYVAKDGSTKVAAPKTTKAGTAGFSNALPATIAVYELEDALFNGTIGGKTGAIAIQNTSSAFIGIRTIRITKGIEEPAPEDTVPPTFTPENWESCGYPEAVVVHNDGLAAKSVSLEVTITKPNGDKVGPLTPKSTVEAGGEATVVTGPQLAGQIKTPGTYTVTITGYWNTNDAEHQINETITYIYKEHTAATPVIENERDATCDAPASHDEVIYCVDCENYVISRETITIGEALDHDMQLTAAEVPAECGKAGTTAVYTCANGCGYTTGGDEIPAKAHRYGNLVVNTFCEEDGYITITCGECGVTFDSRVDQEAKDYLVKFPFINVSAKGHDMQETAAEVPAECGKAGTTAVYTCANGCGKTEGGEEIPALEHDMQLTAAEVPAECGKAGTTAVYTCANGCGKTEGGEEIPAKAHRYGNLVVNTFCEEDGYITITCGECGVTFDSREDQEAKDYLIKNPFFNLAPQGHRYDNDKDTTCNFCDYTRFAHYGSNVDLNGALDYNFYFTPAAGEIEGYYAVIEKNGVETTIELKDDMLNGSTYQITLPGVPAKEMVEEMTITIYDAEGNPISEPVTDSALLYAKRVLASDAFSTEAKTMVVDMLNYIAAAQEYFGYKADQLVTAGLTPEEKALGTQENPVCENNYTRSNEYYYGTNFDLENNISMNMYVTGIGEDGYGVIKYTNHLGEDIELTIQAADCQLSGSYYVFVVEGFVTADGACSEVEAKFYDGNDQLVVEVVDSLESYVARGAATYPWLYEVMKFANSTYEYLH